MPRFASDESLAEVLFEQLGYLIEYGDRESERFRGVKDALLEVFR